MRMKWTRDKPTEPGAYWVRGFGFDKSRAEALVEVRAWRGGLKCNLHETTGTREYDDWFHVADLSPAFRWCGPLVPPNAELSGGGTPSA